MVAITRPCPCYIDAKKQQHLPLPMERVCTYIYIKLFHFIQFIIFKRPYFFKYSYTGDIEGCCHLLEVGVFVDRLVPARFLSLRGTKETDIRNSNVSWRYCPERPIRRGYSKSYVMFVDVVRFQERGVRRGK